MNEETEINDRQSIKGADNFRYTDIDAKSKGLDISSLLGNRKKNVSPMMAAGFSLFIYPGAGQMMNRRFGKAAGFIVLFTAFIALFGYYFIKGALLALAPELQDAPPAAAHCLWGMNHYFSCSVYWGAVALLLYIWSGWDAYLYGLRGKRRDKGGQSPAN